MHLLLAFRYDRILCSQLVTEVQMDYVEVEGFACDGVNAPTQVALERGGIKDGE